MVVPAQRPFDDDKMSGVWEKFLGPTVFAVMRGLSQYQEVQNAKAKNVRVGMTMRFIASAGYLRPGTKTGALLR
jgi:hypothetical protein